MNSVKFRPASEWPKCGESIIYVQKSYCGGLDLSVTSVEYVWYNGDGEYITYQEGDETPCGFDLIVLLGGHMPCDGDMWCYCSDIENVWVDLSKQLEESSKPHE